MQNKILVFSLILCTYISSIYGIFINFDAKNKKYFNEELKDINEEISFSILEENVLTNLIKNKYILEDLSKNLFFDKEKINNFFNGKNIIFLYMEAIQEKLNEIKNDYTFIKYKTLLNIDELIKFDDFKKFINIIEDFLLRNEKITKNKFLNSDTVNYESEYKKYFDELKLNENGKILNINYEKIKSFWKDENEKFNKILPTFYNKVNILKAMDQFKNSYGDNLDKKTIFDYKKLYYDKSEKNLLEIKFNIENLKIPLNKDMINEYNKLIKIMKKIYVTAQCIDKQNFLHKRKLKLYVNYCKDFLNTLNLFFSLFNNKTGNKESSLHIDHGFLVFRFLLKNILIYNENNNDTDTDTDNYYYHHNQVLNSEYYELRIKFIHELFFDTDKVTCDILKIIEIYYHKFYDLNWNNELLHIIQDINYLSLENNNLLSQKNELNFQKYLSKDLINILEKCYNIFILIANYFNGLNCKHKKIKRKMEKEILEKLVSFSFVNEENNDLEILRKSNIKYFLNILYTKFNLETYTLDKYKQYEIIFLSIIFVKLNVIISELHKYKFDLLSKFSDDENLPINLKIILKIMKITIE